jgi:adenosylcobinamide-GDP ribazoletransferase
MRDSRIGTFGASALVLAFACRIAGLATLAERLDLAAVMAALVIVGALSRSAALLPMALLPPARAAGLGQNLGTDSRHTHAFAWGLSAVIAILLASLTALPWSGLALALALAIGAGLSITALAKRLIRGHTGDVAGAVQQAAEVAALLGLLIAVRG